MATHHILCIHGIGSHDNDWVKKKENGETQSFEDLFKETWERYRALRGKFAEKVKLHSIHYDDEINKIIGSWQQQSEGLKAALVSSPALQGEIAWFTDAVDKATAARDEANWRYTHLMDLVMFVGSPTIQDRLVTYAGRQIMDLIAACDEDDDVSLIAHSMGCAVAHKALQALYNEGVETSQGRQTLQGDFRFVNVAMAANTSYALSRDRDTHYKSKVKPSSRAGGGCCTTWINVNHRLDPVGRFMPFDHKKDPSWLDPVVDAAGWCRDIVTTRLSSRDVYSLTHYFRDPSFHLPFFELAFGASFSNKQRRDAIEQFVAQTPEGKFKTLLSHLQSDVLDVSNATSFKAFIQALRAFFGLTR